MSDDQAFRDFLLADKSASRNADPALVPGRVNARVGVTAQPDAQAQFGDLAKRYGVPPAVVENDPEVWKQRAAADEAQQHIDASPKLGQWLGEDPQRAKVSHDSLEAMAGVDHAFSAVFPKNGSDADKLRYWQAVGQRAPLQIKAAPSAASVAISKVRNFGLTLTAGIDSTFAGLDALAAAGFKSVGLDRAAAASKNDAKLGMTRARSNSRAGWGGTLEGGFYQAVESLPVSLGALALGATTGPQSGLAFVGAVSGGQSYLKAQEAGLGHWQSVGFGALDAAVEVGTEAIPLTRFLQNTAVGTSIGKRLLENVVEENVGEQVATALQDLNQWAQIDSNKGKTFADYLAERPDAALQTAIATTMSVGIINASVTAGEFAARRSERKQQQAANAQRAEVLLTGLKELAEAAPVAQRDVSTFENWVRSAAEGTEATDVYIDARTLVQTLQQSGLTEPEIIAALPSLQTELPTALVSNGDVRIPIEEFAARSGELGQSLIPHLRLDPNDMSTSEAQTFMQSAQDEFQKETEKAFAEINADDQFRQSTERVADAVYEKLNQAGRFTPDTNRAYASLHAAFFARLASDLGTTPEEAAARYPLLIQSEGVGEGPGVMDQPQEADEAAAPQIFDQGERAPPALYPAIRHNGKIYKSVSDHLSALSQIPDPAERAKARTDGENRVYVTERGKVLDRFRAQEYAQAHKLISPDAPSWAHTSPDLISENLRKPGRYYADTPVEGYDQSGRPIFYSALQRTVESSKQAKAPASQWKSILQNAPGVKAEELEWSGILDLFDEDPKRVWTRDELVQLLDAGGIKVDEVVLGGENAINRNSPYFNRAVADAIQGAHDRDEAVMMLENDGDAYQALRRSNPELFGEDEDYNDNWAYDVADTLFGEGEYAGTQFKDWSSDPSNDTYRELLLTLPIGEGGNPDRAPSTHWDQPAVVAHVRFMEKRDASGDRVLFIEEVQSDWHQKGRDQGYAVRKEPVDTATLERIRDEADTVFNAARVELAHALMAEGRDVSTVASSGYLFREAIEFSAGTPVRNALSAMQTAELRRTEAQIAFNNARDANASAMSGIPNAPFKSSWPALVMKRMIRWAVDNGYTKIAWTTGEEQADRYNLSSVVDTVVARVEGDGRVRVFGQGGGRSLNFNEALSGVGEQAPGGGRLLTRAEAVSVFGQDLGNRLFDDDAAPSDNTGARQFEGADLKIGGEGMKAFYDRNLVNITNDLIKKYGVKVGSLRIPQPRMDELAATPAALRADATSLVGVDDRLAEGLFDRANEIDADTRVSRLNHGFEISDKLAEAAAGGFPLFQGPRGQIRVGDVTQDPTVITLLQRADLSTFLHESGHFFLEVLMHVAAQPDAPQRVVDDMNAFLKWTGVESMGQWSKMTTNEKREHHERFARGFEAFLYEGNAPSLELKSLFQRFRDWLLTVYRSLTQLNVELNPEVRGIFNRMLASDQAIREAEQQVGYEPILTEKPVGMADEEWEAYQRLGAEATSEAVTDLERRSLRDMRYAGKAAGRELKRLQREIRTMRETMRAEVEADLAREPVYRAQEFMKKGLLDGEPIEGPSKMLLSEVEALYEDRPKLYVDEVKRALGFGQYGMLAKDGIHPEQIAELFGFTSADHMIQDLMLAEPFKKAVETEIDTRMLERYGDITSEKVLQDAVDQAIHNDVRGRFVATEFAALSKAPGKPRVMAAAARSLAEKAVSRLKVRNLRPAQYEAAERRAAKAAAEASAKGDIPLAASEKRNQLINFYGAKASRDALTEIDRIVRYFKKFDAAGTRKNLDTGYLDQIDKLLERFDLRKSVTNRQADKRKSLVAWVERQKEQGFDPLIDEELLDEANRTPYRELTVEEMRGLRDVVKNIEHLARLKKKLLTAKDKREFADAVNDVASAIRENAYQRVEEIIGSKSWWEQVKAGVADFLAMHRKMANWAYVMDGNKTGGAVWERFIRPMNERGNFEAARRAQATKDLGALFDRLKGQNLNKRTFVPAIGKSLSLQDRLMVALNLGNEGNMQRVMDGERWEQDKLNAVLEPLTAEHWTFVQAVWDYLDSFYPEVAAKEIRVSGVAPQKVEARPFERQLADGTTVSLRGGYFPIKYDTARSSRAEADTAAEVLQQMTQGKYTSAQTRRGHTKARAEQVDRPVRKDFGVIFEHVNQVIHDLAWHEYLIDANRLLRAVEIDGAIREAHGPQVLKWLRKALEDIALGDIPSQNAFESVINYVRAGASIAAMGWNLWTSMMQPLGLTQSASRIGTKWVAKGLGRVIGDAAHIESTARWVYDRSEFMRTRALTQQREIAEIRNKVGDKSPLRKTVELAVPAGVVDAVEGSYFTLMAKAQMIADLPTWIGQYEKSMEAGETEERAADLADQAVLDSQGGGQIKDLSGIQRGNALMKLWTNFYSYFNTTYNLMADRTAQLRRVGPSDLPAFAVDQLMLTALPSVLTTLLYQLVKGDDDDWDKVPSKMASDLFGYLTGLMVGLREVGAVLNPDSSYAGPAGARVFSEINKFGKQVQQGEVDEALARSGNQLAGILFHYPAGQVDRTARGLYAMEQGEAGPLAPVVGPPPKQ